MANYIVSDTDLTSVADAIRDKAKISDSLVFPDGFVQGISSITTGSTGSTINNQNKTATPSESKQYITADSGYTGLGTVTVNAISSTYVGSGVAKKSSTDLTALGATVTVPAGYYTSQATKSVSTATLATPSASKGTVSNNQVSVTPSITQSSGYVTGATKSGAAVTVSASELVSGNKAISANGTNIDVTNYKTVSVSVPSSGTTINNQNKTVTPTTSQQSVTADSGYTGLGTVTVDAIPNTYVEPTATKAATIYTPSTSNQIIASGTYLTGTQTISGDSNLAAANIKNGVKIFNVTGTYSGSGGTDTTIASGGATASDIASGKKAYVNGELVTGNVKVNSDSYSGDYTSLEWGVDGTEKIFWPRKTVVSDVLLRTGAAIGIRIPFSEFGTATVDDVASGTTFTSVDGRKLSGNVSVTEYKGDNNIANGVFSDVTLRGSSSAGGAKYVEVIQKDTSDHLIRANAKIAATFNASDFGTATAADVAKGKTFTGADGLRITGTKEDSASAGATVDSSKTVKPSAASTSISFTGLSGEPKSFSIVGETQVTLNTTNVGTRTILGLHGNGTSIYGNCVQAASASYFGATVTSYAATGYSSSYSNGTFTVTSNDTATNGRFSNAITYRLIYTY